MWPLLRFHRQPYSESRPGRGSRYPLLSQSFECGANMANYRVYLTLEKEDPNSDTLSGEFQEVEEIELMRANNEHEARKTFDTVEIGIPQSLHDIREFHAECQERQHTDTDKAWLLFRKMFAQLGGNLAELDETFGEMESG